MERVLVKDLVKVYSSLVFLRVGDNGLRTTGSSHSLDEADGADHQAAGSQ